MPRKPVIKIVKVPLDPSLKIDKPAIFPNMNEMFLEYFENKDISRIKTSSGKIMSIKGIGPTQIMHPIQSEASPRMGTTEAVPPNHRTEANLQIL
jgi:hypothetical protein